MKAILRSLLLVAACSVFTGCFQIERIVNVKQDGSGTITETVIIPKAIIAQMKQMTDAFGQAAGGDAAKPAAGKSPGDPDEAKLKEQASKMGEGVTFQSAKKVSTPTGEGFAAIFTFTDISKVKLDQNPSDAAPSAGPGMDVKSKAPPEIITFQFSKAKPSQLIVNMPPTKLDADAGKKKDKEPKADGFPGGEEMAMAMMKEMFKDMRVTLAIEINGKIVKTDADNVAGNRVTLMDMDFNKLLANPEKFKALSKAEPKGLEEAKALMKGIDGIKFETKPKVTIAFQ